MTKSKKDGKRQNERTLGWNRESLQQLVDAIWRARYRLGESWVFEMKEVRKELRSGSGWIIQAIRALDKAGYIQERITGSGTYRIIRTPGTASIVGLLRTSSSSLKTLPADTEISAQVGLATAKVYENLSKRLTEDLQRKQHDFTSSIQRADKTAERAAKGAENDPSLIEWRPSSLYLGASINLPGKPQGAIPVARRIAAEVALATGHRITSRWMFSSSHVARGYGKHAGLSDLLDIASADYVLIVPLTKTSRGCHLEAGCGFGMDKPVHIVAPEDRDPTAFDHLCIETPQKIVDAVQRALDHFQFGIKVRSFP